MPVRSTGARPSGTSSRTRSRSASTDNRIPRWFSEGLSVYEEHHAKPGWGFNVTPDFLAAFKAGKLVPVSRMNDGFMHPAYPRAGAVLVLPGVARLRADRARLGGEPALLKMLQAYKEGADDRSGLSARAERPTSRRSTRSSTTISETRFAGVLASLTHGAAGRSRASMSVAELQQAAAKAPNDFGVQLLAGAGAARARQGRRSDSRCSRKRARCFPSTAATTARMRCSPRRTRRRATSGSRPTC